MSAYTCEECKYSGGWHDDPNADPLDPTAPQIRCPNRAITEQVQHAQQLAKLANENAWEAAKAIIRDAAQTRAEFSANDLAVEFEQIPDTLHGSAFTWAAKRGLIEASGRMVMHRDPATRHKITVWRSLAYRSRAS